MQWLNHDIGLGAKHIDLQEPALKCFKYIKNYDLSGRVRPLTTEDLHRTAAIVDFYPLLNMEQEAFKSINHLGVFWERELISILHS